MFNENILSKILEIFYQNNKEYCIEAQNGNCINFMRYLSYFLCKKEQNFECGELQSVEKSGKINQCTHMFIKYKNLYFDSIRFGEVNLDSMKDYFKSGNGYYIVYKPGNYYITNLNSEINNEKIVLLDENYSILYKCFNEIYNNLIK